MRYADPNTKDALVQFKAEYGNFIDGAFVPPSKGQYFAVTCPVTGKPYTKVARSDAADVERALDAAHGAFAAWSKTSPTERAQILLRIADRIEQNLERLAVAETWGNGKPVRET